MKMWAVSDKQAWAPIDGRSESTLKPGLYQLEEIKVAPFAPPQPVLREIQAEVDDIYALPGSLAEYVIHVVETFLANKGKYKSMGLTYKRGILMEGKPGSGKTAICLLSALHAAKREGIAVLTGPSSPIWHLPAMLKIVREWNSDLFVLNIMEDIDKHGADKYANHIDKLLPMLDGESQIGNVLHFATTNYIDKLDARLTNRPSRFDEVITVKPPVAKARVAYLQKVLPSDTDPKVISNIATIGKGLNFSHLKDLAVSYYVYGNPPEKTAARLKAMAENRSSGFADGESEDE